MHSPLFDLVIAFTSGHPNLRQCSAKAIGALVVDANSFDGLEAPCCHKLPGRGQFSNIRVKDSPYNSPDWSSLMPFDL